MKIIFLGNLFPAIEYLHKNNDIEFVGVVVERNRAHEELITYCLVENIPLFLVEKKEQVVKKINAIANIDYVFMGSFGWILEEAHIVVPQNGVINFHFSYLPFYRGRHPISRAIQRGEKESGLTIHFVNPGIDTGDIIVQEKVAIDAFDSDVTVLRKQMELLPLLLDQTVHKLLTDPGDVIVQQGEGSYFPPFDFENECHVDWHHDVVDIYNLIRSQFRFKGAFSYFYKTRFHFCDVKIMVSDTAKLPGLMNRGVIVEILSDDTIVVFVDENFSLKLKTKE
jgi:methionyl-tRNA formyltransferase